MTSKDSFSPWAHTHTDGVSENISSCLYLINRSRDACCDDAGICSSNALLRQRTRRLGTLVLLPNFLGRSLREAAIETKQSADLGTKIAVGGAVDDEVDDEVRLVHDEAKLARKSKIHGELDKTHVVVVVVGHHGKGINDGTCEDDQTRRADENNEGERDCQNNFGRATFHFVDLRHGLSLLARLMQLPYDNEAHDENNDGGNE